jgi:hypothetical protein
MKKGDIKEDLNQRSIGWSGDIFWHPLISDLPYERRIMEDNTRLIFHHFKHFKEEGTP